MQVSAPSVAEIATQLGVAASAVSDALRSLAD
jgi:predicted DNA binding protein